MSEMIDTATAVRLLQGMEDVAILCHKSPDGDTLGCGFALLYALQRLGKRAVRARGARCPTGMPTWAKERTPNHPLSQRRWWQSIPHRMPCWANLCSYMPAG